MKFKNSRTYNFDQPLLITVIIIVVFGLISVYNSSTVTASYDFGNKYYFLLEQIKWLIIGFVALFIGYKIPYKNWYSSSLYLLLFSLFLLFIVLIPGIGVAVKGAQRWLPFGGQPSELAKLSLVIYLSAWFSHKEKGRLSAFLILCGLLIGLVLLQPDMGTAVVISLIAFILYFLSNAPLGHFLLLIPAGCLIGFALIKAAPYRFARLTTFLNFNVDPLGASYHIRQILIALGSGGFWGIGLGRSRQKYAYVPEANTDSIFAIIAEEIGFIGSLLLILSFIYLFYRGMKIASRATDSFGKLLASGISIWIASQVIINLCSMVALVPLTGVPLPFISYGGTSLIVLLWGIGILLNISRRNINN